MKRPRNMTTVFIVAIVALSFIIIMLRWFEHAQVYGESLGGGVGAELAVRGMAGGLILQSTFTSITDIGSEFFPWLPVRRLGTIRYDTFGKLPLIKVPVLVMHSRMDGLIGFHHG